MISIVEFNPLSDRDRFVLDPVKSTNKRDSLKTYVVNWLTKKDTVNNDPIFLISGQGGGSRAGCAFFNTISLLDSVIEDKTLVITTASGSGTGTGYYLGLKRSLANNNKFFKILNQPTSNLTVLDSVLYRKDYLSESLFKLLFTDYFSTTFGIDRSEYSRNNALLASELQSFTQAQIVINSKPDSFLSRDWASIYKDAAHYKFPIFLPNSFNIEKGLKAISSPVILDEKSFHPYFDIIDSLKPDSSLSIHQSILLNQLFPILSASASVKGYHYLDGGVYDNLAHETLFDMYRYIASIRDTFTPKRPIILLSIANSNYNDEMKSEKIASELGATLNAATRTIFNSYPCVSKLFGMKSIHNKIDTLFDLKVYSLLPRDEPTGLKKLWQFIKYTPDNDNVILSRYLTQENMDSIISYSGREVNEFKYKLNKYLSKI